VTPAAWNFLLLLLFALQHSGMARLRVRRRTYALASYAVVALGWALWQPLPDVLWRSPGWLWPLWAASFGLLLWAGASLGAGELLGWREPGPPQFREPVLYRFSRHPIYVAVLGILWLRPVMTEGGLLLATTLTVYILIGMHFEERKLVREFGDAYRDYQRRVRPLL
jgi:protein-S-isoprenylcysteine O-methyltransferase Ste14